MVKLAALILAAGESRRYGTINKLLSPYKDRALIIHICQTVSALPFCDRLMVTGHDHEIIAQYLSHHPIRPVYNPDYKDGMGRSLAYGIAHLRPLQTQGVMIFLADMPDIDTHLCHALIRAFAQSPPQTILRPVCRAQMGHPVIFSADYFSDLQQLQGNQGAAQLIKTYSSHLHLYQTSDPACVFDIDQPIPDSGNAVV